MENNSAYKKGKMFNGANYLVFELAKDLRRNMTDAENVLWMHLKQGIRGLKFRRQHPLGIYIADFYCHKVKLIIEADGSIHDNPEVKNNDERRENDLINSGYSVLRFNNKDIMNNISTVLMTIESTVDKLLQNLIIKPQLKSPL